ncbi:hypothetical protein [Enterobacter mori]|uniref:hypothetical protein n=1 Tax=Enterobacter mori TaxID=539813 RepID=UPI003B84365A
MNNQLTKAISLIRFKEAQLRELGWSSYASSFDCAAKKLEQENNCADDATDAVAIIRAYGIEYRAHNWIDCACAFEFAARELERESNWGTASEPAGLALQMLRAKAVENQALAEPHNIADVPELMRRLITIIDAVQSHMQAVERERSGEGGS